VAGQVPSTTRRRWLSGGLWALFAAAGGVLWAAQFGRDGMLVAPWVALVPLALLLGAPRPGWLAWLHGWAYWMAAIPWIVPTLVTFGGLSPGLSWVLMAGLAAYLGLYWAAFAAVGARLWRHAAGGPAGRALALALLGLPALWVALEWVRGWLFSGFPWNLAAYAWVDVAGALPLASWVGPWGVSYLVVLANVGVALGVARRQWRVAAFAVLTPLTLLAVAGRFATPPVPVARDGQPVRVLQPNIANLVAYEPLPVLRNYQRLFAMSQEACDVPGALLVWPESAAWPYRFPADAPFEHDVHALVARGCPLLLNSSFEVDGEVRNAAFLLTPEGGRARYDKRHLVPFGEYVPLQGVFGFLDTIAREAGQFSPADELALLDWGRERLGVAICFEITFPGEVAEAVRAGATALLTITNDAWYGDTAAPWQHFRAVRFRAAENARPLVRAAITGVSALVGADGRVEAQLGVFEQGVLRGRIQGREGLTPYARLPWLVPLLCGIAAAWIAARAALARWRVRAADAASRRTI
jgi:apolipoprotein N-acyltransferase